MSAKVPHHFLHEILTQYRTQLGITYGLSLLVQCTALLVPMLMGNAINGLLVQQYSALVVLISLWLVLTIITVVQKRYDTRVFMALYTQVVMRVITQQRAMGATTSQLVARSTLIREVVDFLERDMPDIFAMIIQFIGSLVMLLLFDWHVTVAALLMLIPVSITNGWLWKPVNRLTRSLNNNLEQRASLIQQHSLIRLQRHFHFMRFLRVKASDLEAQSWGFIELFVVVASIYVLITTANHPGVEAGTIFAVITYFWNFQGSLDRLPILMQSVSRVKDILQRIRKV